MSLTRGQEARAWVNFNGTGTVAIRDSFNVSSITDNGVGDYTVNFDQDMPNANYVVVAGSNIETSQHNTSTTTPSSGYLVGSVNLVHTEFATPVDADCSVITCVIFGDPS